jgi:hypothetical protein
MKISDITYGIYSAEVGAKEDKFVTSFQSDTDSQKIYIASYGVFDGHGGVSSQLLLKVFVLSS